MTARLRISGAAIAVALSVLGCSTTITGTAVKAPNNANSSDDGVDIALLDTGNYPTAARAPLGAAGTIDRGINVEGRRLAGSVLGPWQADPELTEAEQFNTMVLRGHDAIDAKIGKPIGDGIIDHHYITGFVSARHNKTGHYKGLANYVLRFPTANDATAAAHDMAAKSAVINFGVDPIATRPVPIPRYPSSAAVTFRWPIPTPDTRGDVPFAVLAITAHGPYVLCQTADAENPDIAAQIIATALDLQQTLIDKFAPTPVDQLNQLPIDPDGLLAHTLPPSAGNETVRDGVYDAQGGLHLEPGDPVHLQALFRSVGLQQAVELDEIRVYQTPDPDSANRIVADYAKNDDPAIGAIPGMPKAKCFKETLGKWCVAPAQRYAFLVQATQETELHQKMAAQYRMLTGK